MRRIPKPAYLLVSLALAGTATVIIEDGLFDDAKLVRRHVILVVFAHAQGFQRHGLHVAAVTLVGLGPLGGGVGQVVDPALRGPAGGVPGGRRLGGGGAGGRVVAGGGGGAGKGQGNKQKRGLGDAAHEIGRASWRERV